jgi:hypothetical protein
MPWEIADGRVKARTLLDAGTSRIQALKLEIATSLFAIF